MEIGIQIQSEDDITGGTLSSPSLQFYLADNVANPNGYMGPFKAIAKPNPGGRTPFDIPTGLTASGIVVFSSTTTCEVKGLITGLPPQALAGFGFSTIFISKIS